MYLSSRVRCLFNKFKIHFEKKLMNDLPNSKLIIIQKILCNVAYNNVSFER
jgi:hypothetical protein